MSDSTIEHLSEQLRAQGLTWGQTNFAVSLLRAEIDRLRDELAHYKEAATKLSAETYDLEAELAACREREARMRWQPIETAPTDGARILLCGKGGKIADGYYGPPDGFANPKQFVWPYIHANPTHWMPLQAPPAALAEGPPQ